MNIIDMYPDRISPEPNSGCWLWDGTQTTAGYGVFKVSQKMHYAHRVSYELSKGPIIAPLEIDHLCRVRCCVNPDHLELVTPGENVRRGISAEVNRRRARSRTHCMNGHEMTEQNTYFRQRGSHQLRECRICKRRYNLADKARRRSTIS